MRTGHPRPSHVFWPLTAGASVLASVTTTSSAVPATAAARRPTHVGAVAVNRTPAAPSPTH